MYRVLALRLALILFLVSLLGRLYQLQLAPDAGEHYENVAITRTRAILVTPRRGEIFASDGTTLLAESVPIFNIAIQPGSLPPADTERRARVLARLAQIASITSTLTLTPTLRPENPHALDDLSQQVQRLGFAPAPAAVPPSEMATTLTITPAYTLEALALTQVYSDMLTLNNPVELLLQRTNTRGYDTVIVKEDISQTMALAVRENASYLPGVVVVEDYHRRYPLSAEVPSISHLLGYLGRIDRCELLTENPAPSWTGSMIDVVSNVHDCGVFRKQIVPSAVGAPLYKHDDRIGKDGLEGSYEAELRGTIGIQMVNVDALERPLSTARTWQPVRDGNNLILTIDMGFQQEVETILRTWLAESERRRLELGGYRVEEYDPITNGVAVVQDARDGRVLAMVSLPAYDDNVWVDRSRAADLQNLLRPADPEAYEELVRLAPLTNRAIAGRYPSGSSLKPFVGAAALQMGVIAPDTRLRDPGRIVLRERSGHSFVLPNSVPRDNGEITISDALMVSSNVFFASIGGGNNEATNLGEDTTVVAGLKIGRLAEGLSWFGLGQPTGIRLLGEAAGRVPNPSWKSHTLREPWTTGDTYNASIGQGYMENTPLQMNNAMVAIANNGTLYRPQLVQRMSNSNGATVEAFQPEIISHIPVEPHYLAVMREGMRRSITEGINVAARDHCSGLSIAGKTGTAEFGPSIINDQGKIARQSHAWFVGFAPYDTPQIVVTVLLEGTGDLNDGSATLAVPATTQIMQAYFDTPLPADPPLECPDMPPLPGAPEPPNDQAAALP